MKSLKERTLRKPKNSEEHILPLINVVFLLLVFFMIAGQLTVSDPFKIKPSRSISSAHINDETAIIHIGKEGQLAFKNTPLEKGELKRQVSAYLKDHPNEIIRLKVDGDFNAGKVLTLMTDLRESGVEKLSLITQLVTDK